MNPGSVHVAKHSVDPTFSNGNPDSLEQLAKQAGVAPFANLFEQPETSTQVVSSSVKYKLFELAVPAALQSA
jgi:hypothetical protein